MRYNIKFVSYASKGVHTNRNEPPKLGSAGTQPLGTDAWLTPPRMCYHVKFFSSATKGIRINRKEPTKLASAGTPPPRGRGVADPKKYDPLHVCYPADFGCSGQTVRGDSAEKLNPRVPPFKVTQGHRN